MSIRVFDLNSLSAHMTKLNKKFFLHQLVMDETIYLWAIFKV